MPRDWIDELTSTPEGMRRFQQERSILEVTELISVVMEARGVSRSELATRLGKSRAFVTQLLDGRANMTLRTISDTLGALGCSLHASAAPLALETPRPRFESEPSAPEISTLESKPRRVDFASTDLDIDRGPAAPFRVIWGIAS